MSHSPAAATSAPAWRLCLLGQPLLAGDRKIVLRPKDAVLLALVALSGPISAERLAALLWPSATARQAETSLRQRLFRLRRALGAEESETEFATSTYEDPPAAQQTVHEGCSSS